METEMCLLERWFRVRLSDPSFSIDMFNESDSAVDESSSLDFALDDYCIEKFLALYGCDYRLFKYQPPKMTGA
jgi:hypothetical protein